MKRIFTLLGLLLGALTGLAGIVPEYYYTTDVSRALSARALRHVQGSSAGINWRFENGTGVPFNLTGANNVYLRYGPTDNLWGQTCTGSVVSATNGTIRVPLTPANTATNGTYPFDIRVTVVTGSTTDVLCRAYGDSVLIAEAGASSATFPVGTNIDLLYYTFLNYPWLTSADLPTVFTDTWARAYASNVNARVDVVGLVASNAATAAEAAQTDASYGTNWILTNLHFRVTDIGGGKWQTILPGE